MDSKTEKTGILITGGCGFVASNLIQRLLATKKYFVVNVDKLYYCASIKNIEKRYNFETKKVEDVDLSDYKFFEDDINSYELISKILVDYQISVIYHFAAQSCVDQSFNNSSNFVIDNILGTTNLLECAKEYGKLDKFIMVSTDEIYGEITPDKEASIYQYGFYDPTNPYSASKAASELMVKSFQKSYKLPIVITRSNNIYGPHQYWEKIIPKFSYLLEKGKKCTIFGNGSAQRTFLFVDDVVDAYQLILEKGEIGKIYEMNSTYETNVIDLAKKIIKAVKPNDDVEDWINYVEARPFEDCRYMVNPDNIKQLGWKEKTPFDKGFMITIEWYTKYAIPMNYWDEALDTSLKKVNSNAFINADS